MTRGACINSKQSSRGNYKNEFIGFLAHMMFIIGYGDIIHFPYHFMKYGLGYIIPYLAIYLLVGVPLLALEMHVGQFQNLGPIKAYYNMAPILKGVGWGLITNCTFCLIYFNLFLSASVCLFLRSVYFIFNKNAAGDIAAPVDSFLNPENEFEPNQSNNWFLAYIILWIIAVLFIWRGLQAMGNIIVVLTAMPIFLLIILISLKFFGTTDLNGDFDVTELKSLLWWDKSVIFGAETWVEATKHVIFDLGLGFGVVTTLASYNFPTTNYLRIAFLLPLAGVFFGFGCLLLVFNHYGDQAEAHLLKVLSYYSKVFSIEVSAFIYLLASFNGFSSLVPEMESVFTALFDQFPELKRNFHGRSMVFCGFLLMLPGISFCFIPGVFRELVEMSMTFSIFMSLVLSCAGPFATYHYTKTRKEMDLRSWKITELYLKICWSIVTPIVLVVALAAMVFYGKFNKSSIVIIIIYLIFLISISILQVSSKPLEELVKPTSNFCLEVNRTKPKTPIFDFISNNPKILINYFRLKRAQTFNHKTEVVRIKLISSSNNSLANLSQSR